MSVPRDTLTPVSRLFTFTVRDLPTEIVEVLVERIKAFAFIFMLWRDEFISKDLDKRSRLEIMVDRIMMFFPELFYHFATKTQVTFGSENYHYLNRKYEWKQESKGLFVFVHGLHSHPSDFKDHIAQLGDEYDVFDPFVPEKGCCTLEESAEPIYQHIKDYAQQFPDRKICLIGHSNGGRIIDYIDIRMREDCPKTPLKISTIAAAHLGSRMASLATFIWGSPHYMELSYKSHKAQETIEKVRAPLAPGVAKREYVRYATFDDHLVPLESSLVRLDKGEKNYVTKCVGHARIVPTVRDHQMDDCKRFFV